MPYKSKRTRDLQGEVVAGTGITITEQTKPDGTKEYTITNGDPASAITVDGTGLSLISNVLRNTMAAIMGWSGDNSRGAINWTDDNGDTVLKIIPLEELFIGDAKDNNDFIIKHINGENRLIRGTLQIAESINSTGGVSLNDIALLKNISLSATQYQMQLEYDNTNSIFYSNNLIVVIPQQQDIHGNYFYTVEDFTIDNITYQGLKVSNSGIYKISIHVELVIETNGAIADTNDTDDLFSIKCYNQNTQTDSEIYPIYSKLIDFGNDGTYYNYYVEFNFTGFINLMANDCLYFIYNCQSIYNIYTSYRFAYNDPYVSIQKVS